MTVAASAGILAGMLTRGAQYGAIFGGARRDDNNGGLPVWLVVLLVSLVDVRRQLRATPAAVALPRALGRPVGRLPDDEARALASALQKITGEISRSRSATCARCSR